MLRKAYGPESARVHPRVIETSPPAHRLQSNLSIETYGFRNDWTKMDLGDLPGDAR